MQIGTVLSAIGSGLRGGVEGYTLGKDLQRQRRRDEADQEYRDEEQRRRNAAELRQQGKDDAATAATKAELEAQDAILAGMPDDDSPLGRVKKAMLAKRTGLPVTPDMFAPPAPDPHTTTEAELPEGMRPSYHASGHKPPSGGYKPEDFIPPEQRQQAVLAEEERKRTAGLKDFRDRAGITDEFARTREGRATAKAAIPVTSKDDPLLPRGVSSYLGTLPTKHGGDYAGAFAEFQQQLPGLMEAHPRLDVRRARAAFDALFPHAAIPAGQTGRGTNRLFQPRTPGATPSTQTSGPVMSPSSAPDRSGSLPMGAGPSSALAAVARSASPGRGAPPAGVRGRGGMSAAQSPVGDDEVALHARAVLQQNGQAITPQNLQTFIVKNRARLEREIQTIRARQ